MAEQLESFQNQSDASGELEQQIESMRQEREQVRDRMDVVRSEHLLRDLADTPEQVDRLVHAGFAIGVVDAEEAAKSLELLREYSDAMVEL